ncbi:hypothetical protein ACVWYH_002370 [Bradyrhizobium sp. GM24.11]
MTDVDEASRAAVRRAYAHFAKVVPALKIMLATYFGAIGDNLETTLALPVAGLHVDLVRAPDQLDAIVAKAALTVPLDNRNPMPVAPDMQAADLVTKRVRATEQRRMSWFDEYIQCHRCDKRQSRLDIIAQKVL